MAARLLICRCRQARRAGARGGRRQRRQNFLRSFGFTSQGSSYAAYANHLDLDPTYKDRFGRPLLRMTFDFPDNDIRMSNYVVDKMELIAKAMNPATVCRPPPRQALQRGAGSEYAQYRRRDHGSRSKNQRG